MATTTGTGGTGNSSGSKSTSVSPPDGMDAAIGGAVAALAAAEKAATLEKLGMMTAMVAAMSHSKAMDAASGKT